MVGDAAAENKPLHLPSRFGDLPACWSWLRLDDACDGVFDCPHSTPQLVDTGPFVVRSQDIITGVFRTEEAALAWLESLGYKIKHGPEIAPGELFAERTATGAKDARVQLGKLGPGNYFRKVNSWSLVAGAVERGRGSQLLRIA